jgi:hypothetical protein
MIVINMSADVSTVRAVLTGGLCLVGIVLYSICAGADEINSGCHTRAKDGVHCPGADPWSCEEHGGNCNVSVDTNEDRLALPGFFGVEATTENTEAFWINDPEVRADCAKHCDCIKEQVYNDEKCLPKGICVTYRVSPVQTRDCGAGGGGGGPRAVP